MSQNQVSDATNEKSSLRVNQNEERGLVPKTRTRCYPAKSGGDQDPWKYVISHSLHRRHLTTSQRATVANKLATLKHGDVKTQKNDGQKCPSSTNDAAKALNVSPRSVKNAKSVNDRGSESVKQAVEQGSLPVSVAAKLVKEVPDKAEQAKIVAKGSKAVRMGLNKVGEKSLEFLYSKKLGREKPISAGAHFR